MEAQTVNWTAAIFVLVAGAIVSVLVYLFAGKFLVQMVNEDEQSLGRIAAIKSPPYIAILVFLVALDRFIKMVLTSYQFTVLTNMIIFGISIVVILKMVKSIRIGATEARYGIKNEKNNHK